jgi:excinuclease ABC subunit A
MYSMSRLPGLHPADTEALLRAFDRLKAAGNSLFVVEHELDIIRRADWIVDVGPGAGEHGGRIIYSGPPAGLAKIENSRTGPYLFGKTTQDHGVKRTPTGWLQLRGITRNNLNNLDVDIPLGVFTSITGISGSGKSTLISQFLVGALSDALGLRSEALETDETDAVETLGGDIVSGLESVKRLVVVDQRPIGRTPRSNLATYTGLFDQVRRLFAATKQAKARRYDAGRFSFNVTKGRCATCEGEGFVSVELLFLPSVFAPCPSCKGSRYNEKTLEIKIRGKSVADVLQMTADEAFDFFSDDIGLRRSLGVIQEVGLGYIRLGQAATELSGGEAQRIKLATELQRAQRGQTLYVLDEPTTGLHPSDVEKLVKQLNGLVNGGNTVLVVEHDMALVSQSDWIIDVGPGAGDEGGTIVAAGIPSVIAATKNSRTAPYLARISSPALKVLASS